MTTERRSERRIFVVGVPRSGTTLVQSLLAAHDEVASWIESHFFDRLFRLVPGLPSRALLVRDPEPEVRAFLQAVDESWDDGDVRWAETLPGWRLRTPVLWSDGTARSLVEIYDDLAACQGCPTWVEKTPAHLRYVPFLERLLADDPSADAVDLRFVHVIRDGLETVASLHAASKQWERAYGVDECVRRWNREVTLSLARAGSKRDVFVFYEELTSDPETATRKLFEEVGLVWQPDVLQRYGRAASAVTEDSESWKAETGRAIEPSSTSEWNLTDEQRRLAERGLRRDLYDELRRRTRT